MYRKHPPTGARRRSAATGAGFAPNGAASRRIATPWPLGIKMPCLANARTAPPPPLAAGRGNGMARGQDNLGGRTPHHDAPRRTGDAGRSRVYHAAGVSGQAKGEGQYLHMSAADCKSSRRPGEWPGGVRFFGPTGCSGCRNSAHSSLPARGARRGCRRATAARVGSGRPRPSGCAHVSSSHSSPRFVRRHAAA